MTAIVTAVLSAGPAAGAASAGHALPGVRGAEVLLLGDAVASLPVAGENRQGYVRSAFRHWVDADHDGCTTRREVLLEEAVTPPRLGARCAISGGSWYSYYDDATVDRASGLDIDHVVPLAEAWDSGAYAWDAARRQAYANDLDEPRALVAVTARANRSKADQDPAEWLPPFEPARCRYLADWVTVKLRWHLSVDPAERRALASLAVTCPDDMVTVTPAL